MGIFGNWVADFFISASPFSWLIIVVMFLLTTIVLYTVSELYHRSYSAEEFQHDHILNLEQSQLETLDPQFFDNKVNTTELLLSGNNLSEIPHGIFDNMVNLVKIDLSNNKLTSLPPLLFSHLPKLKYVNLSSNHLTTLPIIPDVKCDLSRQTPLIGNNNVIDYELNDDVTCYISHEHIFIGSQFRMCENPVPHYFLDESWNAWEMQCASKQCIVCRSYQVPSTVYKRVESVHVEHGLI
jgi:hypothetical protein